MKNSSRSVIFVFAAAMLIGCASQRSARESFSSDEKLARTTRLARVAWDKSSLAQAETLFREAHRRARETDNAAGLGDAAYNLAAVLIALDRSTEAEPLLDEAEAELKRANQSTADVLLVKAKLAISTQRAEEAVRTLDTLEKSSTLVPAQQVQVALLRGEMAVQTKNREAAKSSLIAARKFFAPGNLNLAAGIEKLSGDVALLESLPADAAAAFVREAKLFQSGKNYRAMGQALARAGEAFAQAGNSPEAAEYFYRAARSTLAQGDVAAAKKFISRGKTLAQSSQDKSLQSRFE